jgi:hypothetical protein
VTAENHILAERATRIEERLRRPSDEGGEGPVSAAALASAIEGHEAWSHETRRRRVREAVDYGRTQMGMRICANGEGYWMARDAQEWAAFQEAQKRGAVFKFVRIAKAKAAASERISGQQTIGDWGRRTFADPG